MILKIDGLYGNNIRDKNNMKAVIFYTSHRSHCHILAPAVKRAGLYGSEKLLPSVCVPSVGTAHYM
jgi:hypothetical protein